MMSWMSDSMTVGLVCPASVSALLNSLPLTKTVAISSLSSSSGHTEIQPVGEELMEL